MQTLKKILSKNEKLKSIMKDYIFLIITLTIQWNYAKTLDVRKENYKRIMKHQQNFQHTFRFSQLVNLQKQRVYNFEGGY